MVQGPELNSERSDQSGHRWMQSSMQSSMPNQVNRESNSSLSLRTPDPKRSVWGAVILRGALAVLFVLVSTGCVTKGDFLRLQERVAENHRSSANEPDPFARIAQLSADVEALRQEVRDLQGELELARKEAADALLEARRTRTVLAGAGAAAESAGTGAGAAAGDESQQGAAALGESRTDSEVSPEGIGLVYGGIWVYGMQV